MSRTVIGLIAALALVGQPLAQETSVFNVYARDQLASFDPQKELALKFWLQQLMLSTLYRNVVQDSSLDEWQRNISAPTRIHAHYPKVVFLAIPERPVLSFDEALLPLSSDGYPAYIFIKHGKRVQRLAKYDPWVLHKLVSEANLPLYEKLSAVERGLF
jgi:hypothetical protein